MDLFVCENIIQYLPIDSLFRFKVVSKDWYHLIQRELESRISVHDERCKTHQVLKRRYPRGKDQGDLRGTFQYAPLALVFQVFVYRDFNTNLYFHDVLVSDLFQNKWLIHRQSHKKYHHLPCEFRFYPLEDVIQMEHPLFLISFSVQSSQDLSIVPIFSKEKDDVHEETPDEHPSDLLFYCGTTINNAIYPWGASIRQRFDKGLKPGVGKLLYSHAFHCGEIVRIFHIKIQNKFTVWMIEEHFQTFNSILKFFENVDNRFSFLTLHGETKYIHYHPVVNKRTKMIELHYFDKTWHKLKNFSIDVKQHFN